MLQIEVTCPNREETLTTLQPNIPPPVISPSIQNPSRRVVKVDQEALELGLLLSQQQLKYGINMIEGMSITMCFVSLLPPTVYSVFFLNVCVVLFTIFFIFGV